MDQSLALDSIAKEDIQTLLNYGDELVEKEKTRINEALHKVVDQVIGQELNHKCENFNGS